MVTLDPLGLERCQICSNAFVYDADEAATEAWREAGHSGFVCVWCAPRIEALKA